MEGLIGKNSKRMKLGLSSVIYGVYNVLVKELILSF